MTTAAIAGYGRFGQALAGLLAEAGVLVRAFDPRALVPEGRRAPSLAELPRGAEVVVIAAPVPAIEEVARALVPSLEAGQLVIDVGSVKARPEEALRRALGGRVAWCATHPLFGPTSLARAERPLRAVVCPNEMHPGAAARARAFYERIGCQVLEQDAHAHDRAMAETHALAFFVAKGILDAGVGLDVPYAPPSFQAIARTVDAVRSDAGHLFAAIERENPYAEGARRRLLDALLAVDRALCERGGEAAAGAPGAAASPPAGSAADPALAIPDLGARSPALRLVREHIDEVDRRIVELLQRRGDLARRAAREKAALGLGIVDPAREAEVIAGRREWARELGGDPETAEEVFRALLRGSRRAQGGPATPA